MSKAQIQKPAPPFSGTAVNVNGEFIDLKLSDFKGMDEQWLHFLVSSFDYGKYIYRFFLYLVYLPAGKYCVLFFYPLDLWV